MNIYLLCPWIVSGGPEAIHQLCHTINDLNLHYNAYILYYDLGLGIGNPLYTDIYKNINIINHIEDYEDNVIIIPESYINFINIYSYKCKILIWWLSYDYGIDKFNNLNSIYKNNIIHICQSFYAYIKLTKIIDNTKLFLLSDYIRPNIINEGYNINDKQNITAINPIKDKKSYNKLIENDKNVMILYNLSTDELVNNLKKCKVYVDFGNHPGKDRIPREAASLGCIIITNKEGSAFYNEDMNIEEKLDNINDLNCLIDDIYNNYEKYLMKQHNYRNNIIKEEFIFRDQIRMLINYLENKQ